MKVAIMTQPLGHNYGGLMQAWALQQVLKDAGHLPVTIDRRSEAKSPLYRAARLGYFTLQKIMGKREAPINIERFIPYIQKNTKNFINNCLTMSDRLESTEQLKEHFEREKYDAVIVGSDQTWRPCYSPNIENYFLDFLQGWDIKRIAYASSFGVDQWEFTEQQTRRCALLAKKFDAIGVRESSGVELCSKYLGVESTLVLDPTLLVRRESYEDLYKRKDIPLQNGIYTYILDKAEWKDKVVETVKQLLNKSQFNYQAENDLTKLKRKNLDNYLIPNVAGWIKSFANSDFIITDSFHGTVFSIIFNKPFISLINQERGASRFKSLLSTLGLLDRSLTAYDKFEVEKIVIKEIDYNKVNRNLEIFKLASTKFLSRVL